MADRRRLSHTHYGFTHNLGTLPFIFSSHTESDRTKLIWLSLDNYRRKLHIRNRNLGPLSSRVQTTTFYNTPRDKTRDSRCCRFHDSGPSERVEIVSSSGHEKWLLRTGNTKFREKFVFSKNEFARTDLGTFDAGISFALPYFFSRFLILIHFKFGEKELDLGSCLVKHKNQ